MEYTCNTPEGTLYCGSYKKGMELKAYKGEDRQLVLPDRLLSIGKKALLSCKSIRSVHIGADMESIGDWAFAYCDELREVYIPKKNMQFGKGIFMECPKLKAIYVEGTHTDMGGLLAAAVTLLDAPFLLNPLEVGTSEWIKQWDMRMLQLLHGDDHEGYSKMVLCGEEDYGSKENNLDYFLNQKRKSKVRIAFMRLLNPYGMQDTIKRELEEYLRSHRAGEENQETWQVLQQEYGEDRAYYEKFAQIGCLTEQNFDGILQDIGNNNPEMKAYFIRYKEKKIGYSDFFSKLDL